MTTSNNLPPFFFQHIRKTGGTTATEVFETFFPPTACRSIGDVYLSASSMEEVDSLVWGACYFHGHADLAPFIRGKALTFTMLREPLPRLCSERRQWTQASREDLAVARTEVAAATRALQSLPLVEILGRVFDNPVVVPSFWNHQALSLGAWPLVREFSHNPDPLAYAFHGLWRHFRSSGELHDWLIDSQDAILSKAIERLRSFDYVGITEDLETSLRTMLDGLGFPQPAAIAHLNQRSAYADEADSALAGAARPFLELDLALYEEAQSLHARPTLKKRLERADYIGRTVLKGERRVFRADSAPGGYGWHRHHAKPDGRPSRWSGVHCYYALSLESGDYEIEAFLFGAVSEAAIRATRLHCDGQLLPSEVRIYESGQWSIAAKLRAARNGLFDVEFKIPGGHDNFGLELEKIIVASLSEGSEALALVSRLP